MQRSTINVDESSSFRQKHITWWGAKVKSQNAIYASEIIRIVKYQHSAVSVIQDEICVMQAGRKGEDDYALWQQDEWEIVNTADSRQWLTT